jgi:hypothetical protein
MVKCNTAEAVELVFVSTDAKTVALVTGMDHIAPTTNEKVRL